MPVLIEDYKVISKTIKQCVQAQISLIEPKKNKHVRNDIFKTKIARAACRLGLELVYFTDCKLVRITDYKSPDFNKFERTFRKVFESVWNELRVS